MKDRRKPWQKTLKTLRIAKCGHMTQETERAWKSAITESDRDMNAVHYGKNGSGRRPSLREVQYWQVMTRGDSAHAANIGNVPGDECEEVNTFLRGKGVMYA